MRDQHDTRAGTVPAGQASRGVHLSRTASFRLLGVIIGLLLVASSLPSPMYLIYQARWHFSATVLIGVFAVYALAVLIALLLFGAISDQVGLRPTLIVSLGTLIVTMGIFSAARSSAWLFVARAIQGLAAGAISAGLIDMHPSGDTRREALVNSSAPPFGMAAGGLICGVLVQYGPWPTVFPYLLMAGATLAGYWPCRRPWCGGAAASAAVCSRGGSGYPAASGLPSRSQPPASSPAGASTASTSRSVPRSPPVCSTAAAT